MLVSSTLALVFLTTIIFGALMPMMVKIFRSLDDAKDRTIDTHHDEDEMLKGSFKFEFIHPNFYKT